MILVTGGAGFIGANFVLDWMATGEPVVNLDAPPTPATSSLASLRGDDRHVFVHGDITDRACSTACFATHRPRAVVHFAAESHVDRSIHGPAAFIARTSKARSRCSKPRASTGRAAGGRAGVVPLPPRLHRRGLRLPDGDRAGVHRVPSVRAEQPLLGEQGGRDHLVRAWHHTYGPPVLTTNCSNNYGPLHFPEKLIPLMIVNALAGPSLPVYGDGMNVRDWLYVGDHRAAIREVLARGRVGETYNVGGGNEMPNIEIVRVCALARRTAPDLAGSRTRLIAHVTDRPGHDRRYAIDATQDRTRARLASGRDLRLGPPQDRAVVLSTATGSPTCRAAPTATGSRSTTRHDEEDPAARARTARSAGSCSARWRLWARSSRWTSTAPGRIAPTSPFAPNRWPPRYARSRRTRSSTPRRTPPSTVPSPSPTWRARSTPRRRRRSRARRACARACLVHLQHRLRVRRQRQHSSRRGRADGALCRSTAGPSSRARRRSAPAGAGT